MSPETGNRLIQAGITTTPHEALKGYSIPRRDELFPESIRESTSPNEASQESWHDRNFPKSTVSNVKTKIKKFQQFINFSPQVKTYYNPPGSSTPRETRKPSSKLADTDMAEGGSNV